MTPEEAERIAIRSVKHRPRPLMQFDLKGNLLTTWKSAYQAHKLAGYDWQAIGRCALGKRLTAYGFIWRFKDTPIIYSREDNND